VGENVDNYPDIAERILKEGHEIGNHTYTHGTVSSLGAFQIKREIERCEAAIYEQTDCKTKLFRPPQGFLDANVKSVTEEMDYRVILWDVDTRDWAHAPPKEICRNVCDHVSPGSIILMHDYVAGQSNTPAALEEILPALLEKGYTFLTVDQLLLKD
jgi:peptidoglycan/xylan/chitin deacetylase (PgdA/CDA1 family)